MTNKTLQANNGVFVWAMHTNQPHHSQPPFAWLLTRFPLVLKQSPPIRPALVHARLFALSLTWQPDCGNPCYPTHLSIFRNALAFQLAFSPTNNVIRHWSFIKKALNSSGSVSCGLNRSLRVFLTCGLSSRLTTRIPKHNMVTRRELDARSHRDARPGGLTVD